MMNYNKFRKECGVFGRIIIVAFAMFLSLSVHAQQKECYAQKVGDNLIFKYGIPEGKNIYNFTRDYKGRYSWYNSGCTTVVFDSSFIAAPLTRLDKFFCEMYNLTTIIGIENLNTSNVTRMDSMFTDTKLTSLDLSSFNTSNVTNMKYMFKNCKSLTSLNLSSFNTSKVTNMIGMFHECRSLTSLNLSSFNTSNVTSMGVMFYRCSSLTSLDISNFNTSNVTDMGHMFYRCSSLTSLDLSNFNTSNVTDMGAMFYECQSLTSLDISNFNTSKVTDMSYMFYRYSSLTSLDISNFNTSNVTDMKYMFSECPSLTSLDLSHFNTRKVVYMSGMFKGCSNLKSVTFGKDFSVYKTYQTTTGGPLYIYTNDMFNGCENLRYVDCYTSDGQDDVHHLVAAGYWSMVTTSFPTTAVLYLPYGLPIEALNSYLTDKQNVVYAYNGDETDLRCNNYYSEDKKDIEFPRTFKTNEAVYTRDMTGKEYGSVILPYDFTSNSDIQVYSLSGQNKMTHSLTFTEVETVPAHTPFAFKRKNKAKFLMKDDSGNFGITVYATRSTNATEKTRSETGTEENGSPYEGTTGLSNWKTKGYYVKETVTDFDGMYFIQNNEFKRAVGNLNLVDHRVLFYPTDAATGNAKFFTLSFGDENLITAIEAAETEKTIREATDIYDVLGRRQTSAKKGLNIVRMNDGTIKKVFVK